MNLQYLRYFQVLSKWEHFTKAAEELGIAQSSLSHAVHSLENELGVYLFEKQGRNVVLTTEGRCFSQYVKRALEILDEGIEKTQNAGSEYEPVRIGYVSAVHQWLLEKISKNCHKERYKRFRFSLGSGQTYSLLENLKRKKYDIVFCTDPVKNKEYTSVPVEKRKIVLIVPENHFLAGRDLVAPSELKDVPLILHTQDTGTREAAESILRAGNVEHPLICQEAADDRDVVSLVKLGMGAAFIFASDDIKSEGICAIPLECDYDYRYICLVYAASEKRPEVLALIHMFLQEQSAVSMEEQKNDI